MPRILGIDVPANKPIEYSLRSIYGIGPAISVAVLENAGIDRARRTHTLSEEELAVIAKAIASTKASLSQTAFIFVACCTAIIPTLFFAPNDSLFPCQHWHNDECTKWAGESLVPEVFPVVLRCS